MESIVNLEPQIDASCVDKIMKDLTKHTNLDIVSMHYK